jgi:hypothetical protein
MIKKRIAALAMGAALATSAIIAPQVSADTQHRDTHNTHGKGWGDWEKNKYPKKHHDGKGKHHDNKGKHHDDNKGKHHEDKGNDNYKHHRGSFLSSW